MSECSNTRSFGSRALPVAWDGRLIADPAECFRRRPAVLRRRPIQQPEVCGEHAARGKGSRHESPPGGRLSTGIAPSAGAAPRSRQRLLPFDLDGLHGPSRRCDSATRSGGRRRSPLRHAAQTPSTSGLIRHPHGPGAASVLRALPRSAARDKSPRARPACETATSDSTACTSRRCRPPAANRRRLRPRRSDGSRCCSKPGSPRPASRNVAPSGIKTCRVTLCRLNRAQNRLSLYSGPNAVDS